MSAPVHWSQITPQVAARLPADVIADDVVLPLTSEGWPCRWPWEPQQLVGVPMGQYHCGYCGDMQLAGMGHLDWGWDDLLMLAVASGDYDRLGSMSPPPM